MCNVNSNIKLSLIYRWSKRERNITSALKEDVCHQCFACTTKIIGAVDLFTSNQALVKRHTFFNNANLARKSFSWIIEERTQANELFGIIPISTH